MEQSQNHQHAKNWYDKIYKLIIIIPVILIIFSVIYLVNFNIKNGDLIYKDVTLTGGTTVTVFDSNVNIESAKLYLNKEFPDLIIREISDIRTGKQYAFFVETTADADTIKTSLEKYLGYKLTSENSSIEFSGSSLSSGFYQQLKVAILIAFLLMAITVFVIFRKAVPSGIVILSAFADIMMTIVVVDMLGIKLSTGGIVAFLMLIGYSVDTDILLTTRLIKNRDGTINQRIYGAFKTGMTMTLTSLTAIGISFIIIYSFSDTLRQIFGIILIGLGFDILNTWITNTSLLKWYMEAKQI